ncbi:preprotein translocase subunit YajC [Raoultella terrigena]|uniref:Sec translocon accessory complex subunit YajC n=1 Tax=Raoultella terrigena TaxID=577 RepID=A0A4U9D8V3_RAOTE|nr:preprotein translocase subunit YajC [Raoultella terrigena]
MRQQQPVAQRRAADVSDPDAGGVGLIFYFMILRPQQKRSKEHKNLMSSIAKGDEVLTNGGLVGRVTKVAESGYIAIALNDTTEVVIKRDFVAAVLPKGTMKAL